MKKSTFNAKTKTGLTVTATVSENRMFQTTGLTFSLDNFSHIATDPITQIQVLIMIDGSRYVLNPVQYELLNKALMM